MGIYDNNLYRAQLGGVGAPPVVRPVKKPKPAQQTAYEVGQDTRRAVEQGVGLVARPVVRTFNAANQGIAAGAGVLGAAARGFVGAAPANPAQPVLNANDASVAADGQLRAPATVPAAPAATSPALVRPPSFAGVRAGAASAADPQISNTPGTAVINGKVISPERIAALAAGGAPAGEAAAVGGYLPPVVRPDIPRNGAGNPVEAQRFAASDIGSILNEDFRSPLGVAARNARIEAESTPTRIGTNTRQRGDIAASNLANYNNKVNTALGAVLERPRIAAGQADIATREAGDTTRALIGADAAVEQARIQRPRSPLSQINLADGTIAQVGENGVARPVVGADGKPVKPQLGKAPTDQAAYAKIYSENYARLLGADPVSGLIIDEANPKGRQPTAEEQQRATAAARTLTLQALGSGNEGEVFVDANGNRARLVNGQYVPE